MAEFPALPLWTDAYLADTSHLTTIEHGAYLLLLIAMWRGGGTLPDDDRKLARFARLTAGQWKRIKPTIMEFFDRADGKITQGRLTAEMVFVRQHSKRMSDNARSRWLKEKGTGDAKALPEACKTDAPTPTPIISPSLRSGDGALSAPRTANASADDGLDFLDRDGAAAPDDPPEQPAAEPELLPEQANGHSHERPAPKPAAAEPPQPKPQRGTRLPPDWEPPDEWLDWARQEGYPNPVRSAARFKDYWLAQPGQKGVKLDWQATWRNWVRKDIDDDARHHNRTGAAGHAPDRPGSPEQRNRLRAGIAAVLAPELDAGPAGPGRY